ncbi:MAG TPA: hypothetical protein VE825_08485 [Terriglobales bacterium]|nr:hypothetical protein [Terriglobales bacterium]
MQASRDTSVSRTPPPARPPEFLLELEPWGRTFLRNLRDLFRPHPEPLQMLTSRPASFWPDVFVPAGIPRRPLLQSVIYHVFIVVALWGLSNTFVFRSPAAVRNSFFHDQKITYYDVSEYLPAINTGSEPAKVAKKGEPEYSPQRIVSLPKHPDNSTQTIIDPIDPRMVVQEAKLPNMVVWTEVPAPPIAARNLSRLKMPELPSVVPPPAAKPNRNLAQLTAPRLDSTVVAPAPDAGDPDLKRLKLPAVAAPGAVAPAPDVSARTMGDINLGHNNAVVTNPALPMPEQRGIGDDRVVEAVRRRLLAAPLPGSRPRPPSNPPAASAPNPWDSSSRSACVPHPRPAPSKSPEETGAVYSPLPLKASPVRPALPTSPAAAAMVAETERAMQARAPAATMAMLPPAS